MKLISGILSIIIAAFSVLLISCASAPKEEIALQTEDIVSQNEITKYMKPVEINGVIDFTGSEYRFLWDTSPDNGTLLFFSSIPGRAYREEEVELAVSEAARQAAMLSGSKVDAKFAVMSNNRDLGTLEAIEVQYDRGLAADLETKIKIVHHLRDNEGTYILAELDGIEFKGSFSVVQVDDNGPDWLYNVPELPGYLVSIGAVQRSRYKIDSIRRADEQALANLARQVSVVVKAKRTDLQSEGSGSGFSETHYQITSTYIRGFYVLGRWSTDNGSTYYTLAVCPEDQ